MAETSEKSDEERVISEIVTLQISDNPGMQLVSVQMDGSNYLSCSRTFIIALRAKDKIEFIGGKGIIPDPNSTLHRKWQKADNMIISWILNFLSKELASAFVYTLLRNVYRKTSKKVMDKVM